MDLQLAHLWYVLQCQLIESLVLSRCTDNAGAYAGDERLNPMQTNSGLGAAVCLHTRELRCSNLRIPLELITCAAHHQSVRWLWPVALGH